MKRSLALFCLLAALGYAPGLYAQACSSAAGGNWSLAATWNAPCNVAGGPTAANAVTINNGHAVIVNAAPRQAGSLTIAAGATATSVTLANSLTVTNASGGTGNIVINASTATVTRQIVVGTQTLTATGSVFLGGATAGAGGANIAQLTVTSGRIVVNGNLVIGSVTTGGPPFTPATVQSVAQVVITPAAGVGRLTVTGLTRLVDAANANRDAFLTVAAAANAGEGAVLNGGLTIGGNSTAAGSATVRSFPVGVTGRIAVTGTTTNSDTLQINAGTFSTTTLNTTGVSHAAATSVTSGSISVTGNSAVSGGAVNPSGATMSVTTGVITVGGTLGITAGSNTNTNATASVTTGRITVTGDTTVTGGAAAGRNALLTVTAAPAVAGNGINLNGNLSLVSTVTTTATVSTTAVNAVVNVAGNVNNRDRILINTGTFNATGAASTFATTNNTIITTTTVTTGTLAIAGNSTVTGGTTNPSGATMSVTTGIITVGGTLGITAGGNTNTNATVSVTTGRISVTGATTLTGGAVAGRNALLQVGGAPAVAGDGFNVNGTLSTVPGAGGVATASVSITVAAGVVNANGDFTNNGTFTNNAVAGQLLLGGVTSTVNGSFVRGTGTVTMDGSAAQALSGTALPTISATSGLYNFTINNASGVTLGANVSVATTLTFTAGDLITGSANTLTMASTALAIAGAATAQHLVGNLARVFPAVAGTSYNYAVGDGTNYTPVIITFPGAPTSGSLTVSTPVAPAGDQPNTTAGNSGVLVNRSVNRYWTVKNSALAGTATVDFTYVIGDNDGGTTPANYIIRRGYNCVGAGTTRNCQPWLSQTVVPTPTNTLATASGVTIAVGATAESDFSIGELDPSTNFARERQFIYTREQY